MRAVTTIAFSVVRCNVVYPTQLVMIKLGAQVPSIGSEHY